jgi:aldehyde dehydrogenase (NAD+)
MKNLTHFYIDGAWVAPASDRTMDVINPANEQVCAQIALGTTADVDAAVAAAGRAFERYSISSREDRLALLDRIIAEFATRLPDLAAAITAEMGAPNALAINSQAAAGIGHFMTARSVLETFKLEDAKDGFHILREPVGVVGLITPWNWPINQIACKVAPALAAGCAMVLKPSEIAPISAHIFAEIMDEAGVPKGVFNLVDGLGPEVGEAMSLHKNIDMMSFTGSTRAGIEVTRAAAGTVKRVALELGGKSANIILDDADLEKAVGHGVKMCMGNTGQSCNAPTRMLVPRAMMDRVATIAAEAARRVIVGDPTADGTTMGPVVSDQQWNKIQKLIQAGIDEGATLVAGGTGRPEGLNAGAYVRPTIFTNVSNDMVIAREEIFGPVLSILPYDDEDQAVAIANDTPYGLSGRVFGSNEDRAWGIARRLRTGMVHINGADGNLNAPFGGYKQSGNGREWGEAGLEDFLETKAVMVPAKVGA